MVVSIRDSGDAPKAFSSIVLTDIQISFDRMVALTVKLWLASFVAGLIVGLPLFLLYRILQNA